MRFIHTGDWHIGKIVNDFNLMNDQRQVLAQLVDILKQQKVDALVIAGDIYDRSVPPVEAVELVDSIFTQILQEVGVPILVIAGNHDGAGRLDFASSILTKNGLHIAGRITEPIKKIVLGDEHGPVNFYLLPYDDPRSIKNFYCGRSTDATSGTNTTSCADATSSANRTGGYNTTSGADAKSSAHGTSGSGTTIGDNTTSSADTIQAESSDSQVDNIRLSDQLKGHEEMRATHDSVMQFLTSRIKENLNTDERNVLVTHAYVTQFGEQTEQCESERPLSIGGTDFVDPKYFDMFHYTALGHLHRRQKAGSEKIRYSGSLMKYSFSEADHKKGVELVELDEVGNVQVTHIPLVAQKDMRIIRGPVKELVSPEVYSTANTEDYVYAILTDNDELLDPISKLRSVYPNIMGLRREIERTQKDSKTSASEGYKTKTKLELFEEFYMSIEGNELDDDSKSVLRDIIEEVEKGEMA